MGETTILLGFFPDDMFADYYEGLQSVAGVTVINASNVSEPEDVRSIAEQAKPDVLILHENHSKEALYHIAADIREKSPGTKVMIHSKTSAGEMRDFISELVSRKAEKAQEQERKTWVQEAPVPEASRIEKAFPEKPSMEATIPEPKTKKRTHREKKKEKMRTGARYKKSNGRLFVGLGCLLVAGCIAFVALPTVFRTQTQVQKVLIAKTDIVKGETITKDNTVLREVGTYGLPSDIILHQDAYLGKVAQLNIQKGDYLTTRKIGASIDASKIAELIKEGKQLVSISIANTAQALAGHLQPGDKVDVYTLTTDEWGEETYRLSDLLRKVEIYDVENADTKSVETTGENAKASIDMTGGSDTDIIAATITFEVSQAQANELIRAEANDGIHVVLAERTTSGKTEKQV